MKAKFRRFFRAKREGSIPYTLKKGLKRIKGKALLEHVSDAIEGVKATDSTANIGNLLKLKG